MSKVLVDRELLLRVAHDDEGMASLADFEELKRVLAAQPAEAEGVEVTGFLYKNNGQALTAADMDADTFALMARSDFDGEVEKLVRQTDHLAALSAVTAERDAARRECDENEGAMQVWRRRTAQAEANLEALLSEVERLQKENGAIKNTAARFGAALWDIYKTCPECGNSEGHLPGCTTTYEREFGGHADYMKAFEAMQSAAMAAKEA